MTAQQFETDSSVTYVCPVCSDSNGQSVAEFSLLEETTAGEAMNRDAIHAIDLQTFLGMNDIRNEATVRVFSCDECSQELLYFPESGARYRA